MIAATHLLRSESDEVWLRMPFTVDCIIGDSIHFATKRDVIPAFPTLLDAGKIQLTRRAAIIPCVNVICGSAVA